MIQDTDATYKGKEVGKVIPPKVGTGEDPGNNPEDHGENCQADEDGVERDEAAIAGGRDPAHVGSDILGRCLTLAEASWGRRRERGRGRTEGLLDGAR